MLIATHTQDSLEFVLETENGRRSKTEQDSMRMRLYMKQLSLKSSSVLARAFIHTHAFENSATLFHFLSVSLFLLSTTQAVLLCSRFASSAYRSNRISNAHACAHVCRQSATASVMPNRKDNKSRWGFEGSMRAYTPDINMFELEFTCIHSLPRTTNRKQQRCG